jgi:signal peptidase II
MSMPWVVFDHASRLSLMNDQDVATQLTSFPNWKRWFIPAATCVLIFDQLSKWWLFSLPLSTRLPNFLARVENKGVAWSIGHTTPHLVVVLTAILIPVLSYIWWAFFRRQGPSENLAFGLILGGAFGNAIDRLCSQFGWFGLHGVRDFINIDLGVSPANPWPTFNIADSGITLGFLILVGMSFIKTSPSSPARTSVVSDR